jgi:hypothetical protein
MTDERFFALIVALIGFCLGFLVMGLLGTLIGGHAEAYLRVAGFAVGGLLAFALWSRLARS